MPQDEVKDTVFQVDQDIYNKQINVKPAPEKNIGIDTKQSFAEILIDSADSSIVDKSQLDQFTNVTRTRDQIYDILDQMCEDPTLSAVLETYSEDATEYSDNGHIIWAESEDPNIAKYVQFLLDSMQVDKNAYTWTHQLCKYGDVYLKLYRTSDEEKDDLLSRTKGRQRRQLKEDVKVVAHKDNDTYTHYVEMCPNPAELFELTKLGKTYAYIKTTGENIRQNFTNGTGIPQDNTNYFMNTYKFKKSDVYVYPATDFVHGCLFDDSSRIPEEVQIFRDNSDYQANSNALTYKVRRGQSIFADIYKIWRILQLLQNSIILSRLTKSAITRLINVEVGDMPKSDVKKLLARIKSLMEQKTSINTGTSTGEYTNPGAIENLVYVPTHGGQGGITSTEIGGEFDPGKLTDLDFFQDQLFGALRVPKQYFGVTGDSAGFDAGTSLSIISSRYAKMIKRIQKTIIEMITDAVNLMLLQKNPSYINKFEIKMLQPTTAEEKDRKDNQSTQLGIVQSIMQELNDVDDPVIKNKILKSLLSTVGTDSKVIEYLQEYIDKLEENEEEDTQAPESNDMSDDNISIGSIGGGEDFGDEEPIDLGADLGFEGEEGEGMEGELGEEPSLEGEEGGTEEIILPTPEELQIDMTDNNTEI